MLTVRKEKDLLYSPIEKYQTMYKQIGSTTTTTTPPPPTEMKNELKEYMVNYLHGVA
jgi:hypothetical protein